MLRFEAYICSICFELANFMYIEVEDILLVLVDRKRCSYNC